MGFEEYKNESTLAEREERHNAHEVLDRTVDSVEQRLRDFNAAIDAKYEEHYTMYEQFEIKLASSVDRAAHQARMGRAPHDNTKALADLSERLKSVSGRLTTEMQERTASFEDLAAHIQDLRVMMEDVQNKQELHDATAKAERTRYQHGFMIANQGIEEGVSLSCEHNKISQQLEELRLSIKTESEKRAVLHEELKEACGGQSSSLLSQLKHQLDAELISRSKVVTDLVERVSTLADGLVFEVRERRISDEEVGKRLQDLASAIDKESTEREAVVLRSREQLALSCNELVSERVLHNDEINSLMGNLESWKGHVNQQLSDLRRGIELEIDIRQAADEQIEKLCLTTQGKVNEDVRGLSSLRSKIKQEADELREALKVEGALREAGDEVGKNLIVKFQQMETALQAEVVGKAAAMGMGKEGSSSSDDSSAHDNLVMQVQQCLAETRRLQESLEAEGRARVVGDEALHQALHEAVPVEAKALKELGDNDHIMAQKKNPSELDFKSLRKIFEDCLNRERQERQNEYVRLQEFASTVSEQTERIRSSWEQEAHKLWDAVRACTYNACVDARSRGSSVESRSYVLRPPLKVSQPSSAEGTPHGRPGQAYTGGEGNVVQRKPIVFTERARTPSRRPPPMEDHGQCQDRYRQRSHSHNPEISPARSLSIPPETVGAGRLARLAQLTCPEKHAA